MRVNDREYAQNDAVSKIGNAYIHTCIKDELQCTCTVPPTHSNTVFSAIHYYQYFFCHILDYNLVNEINTSHKSYTCMLQFNTAQGNTMQPVPYKNKSYLGMNIQICLVIPETAISPW